MSYVRLPRLTFAGRFQADVSTVNNDVRHYDSGSFEPSFQQPQSGATLNGWWNPDGTGAFRLVDVRVTRAQTAHDDNGSTDPATGLHVTGRQDRTAAKLVDLDPQFQMGSAIFGLEVVLTDGADDVLRGTFHSSAFRDIYFGRKAGARGSASASARFTSVLSDLVWSTTAAQSPTLVALRTIAEKNDGLLSINLMTADFSGTSTLGGLLGSVGPYLSGDPETFVSARRIVVASGQMATASGIGAFDAEVSGNVLSLDLSNALPLAADPGLVAATIGSGPLLPAFLRTPDRVDGSAVIQGVREGQQLVEADLKLLDPIGCQLPDWLRATSGIVDCPLDDEALSLAKDHPIALVQPIPAGGYVVLIREAAGGLWTRAEPFEFRLDPPVSGTTSCTVRARCTWWGAPAAGRTVGFKLLPKQSGGGGGSANDPHPPSAAIPDVNFPADVLAFGSTISTDATGWAANTVVASDPGNPRGYLDGQLYNLVYGLRIAGASRPPSTDQVVLHVREAYDPPAKPVWETDIAPFMTQYGNLYPIMSRWLFAISDPTVARQRANLLALAFGLDMDDPNHMPVTRDLSAGKRVAVLRWLEQYADDAGDAAAQSGAPSGAPLGAREPQWIAREAVAESELAGPELESATDASLLDMLNAVGDGFDGKTQALRDQLESRLSEQSRRAL